MRTVPATLWANSRKNLLTTMGSSELADSLPTAIRVNSFFSAKVAEARILDKLREVSDAYNSGSLGHSEARVMIKDFLGVTSRAADQSPVTSHQSLGSLASTARLDLILNQQEAMFSAVGQYAAGMDPDVKERFPCWEYHAGPNPRPEHAALDGLILNKDDEFWTNHTPPWDFNCNCFLTNAEEPAGTDAAGKMLARTDNGWRVNGIDYSGNAPETGYMFNPAEAIGVADISGAPESYRAAVLDNVRDFVTEEKINRFTVYAPSAEGYDTVQPSNHEDIKKYFESVAGDLEAVQTANGGALPEKLPPQMLRQEALSLGELPERLCNELGVGADERQVTISDGSKQYGLKHWYLHHKKEISDPDKTLEILDKSLFNGNSRAALVLNGKTSLTEHIAIDDPQSGSFVFLRKNGKKWDVVSIMTGDEDFIKRQWAWSGK